MAFKKERHNRSNTIFLQLEERIKWVQQTFEFYLHVHPEYQWKSFVKSFKTWDEYKNWQKKQKNPLFR